MQVIRVCWPQLLQPTSHCRIAPMALPVQYAISKLWSRWQCFSEKAISYGTLNCLTFRLSTVTWSGCHQTADPYFFLLFWYIANDCNINIVLIHWWTIKMVTFQKAVHCEKELGKFNCFHNKQMKNTERTCVNRKVLKVAGNILRFCCVPMLQIWIFHMQIIHRKDWWNTVYIFHCFNKLYQILPKLKQF